MRYLLAAILFTFALSSQAEIFEAWDFSAIDGDVQNNIASVSYTHLRAHGT